MRFLFTILTAFTLAANAQDTSVVLDGSKSQGVKFNWEQIKGEKAEMVDADSMKCLVKGLTQGIYAFRLTAISDCCKSTDSAIVRVVMDKTMGITEDSAVKAAAKEKFTTAEIKACKTVI